MHVDAITRLQDRRKDVLLTLDHIREQQCEAEANTEWKDLRAQRKRSELLAELLCWYSGKLRQIDDVLSNLSPSAVSGSSSLPSMTWRDHQTNKEI